MADQEYIAPIDHSRGSALRSTAAGAIGGGFEKGFKWSAGWTVGMAALGAVIATVGVGAFFTTPLIIGALIGGAVGVGTSPLAGIFGSIFGGINGGAKAANQVKQERGAAKMLEAQVAVSQGQSQAESYGTTVNVDAPSATNNNKFNFPAEGSMMNAASPKIQAGNDNVQYDGQIAGLQRMR